MPYIAFAFSCSGVERLCVCMLVQRVFECVLSFTDISSIVVDISRGFEDLIPSMFEELCAALLKTPGETLQQSLRGSYSTAFGAARSHSPGV